MWKKGSITIKETIIAYRMKQYESSSKYGINAGRISQLEFRIDGICTLNYDRGWDIYPQDKPSKNALQLVLEKYN